MDYCRDWGLWGGEDGGVDWGPSGALQWGNSSWAGETDDMRLLSVSIDYQKVIMDAERSLQKRHC